MAILKAIYKCKQCNAQIVDEEVAFHNLDKAIKTIAKSPKTHTCVNGSGSRTIGILDHVGFWEKK